jgi:hypothetical protein
MNHPDVEACRIIRAQGYRETFANLRDKKRELLQCPYMLGTVAAAEWNRGSRQACEDAIVFARLALATVSTGEFR